jgi:uncharacterized membrane protein
MNTPRLVILLVLVLALLQAVHYAPLLPEQVATHFNSAGQPDDWSSKSAFLWMNLLFIGGMAVLFVGITSLTKKLPNEWINMPHRDYWLAPERRDATLVGLQKQMEWMAAATMAFLLGITQLTIEANLKGAPLDNRAFWLMFGAYIVYIVIWVVRFVRSFNPPPHRDLA